MCYKSRLKQSFQKVQRQDHMWPVYNQPKYVGYLQFFSHSPSSAFKVTELIRLKFPACESQRDTKGLKEIFYIGIERYMVSHGSPTTSLEAQLSFKDTKIEIQPGYRSWKWKCSQQQSLMAQQSAGSTAVQRWAVPCPKQDDCRWSCYCRRLTPVLSLVAPSFSPV